MCVYSYFKTIKRASPDPLVEQRGDTLSDNSRLIVLLSGCSRLLTPRGYLSNFTTSSVPTAPEDVVNSRLTRPSTIVRSRCPQYFCSDAQRHSCNASLCTVLRSRPIHRRIHPSIQCTDHTVTINVSVQSSF